MQALEDLLNYDWVLLVGICMLVHLNGICVFGFCNDPTMQAFEPSIASAVYTLAISWLIAEYPMYPCSLKRPHRIIVFAFEVLMALMITNVLLMFFWIPLLRMMANVLSLDSCSYLGKLICLTSITEYVDPDTLLEFVATLVALGLLIIVVYVTETPQLIRRHIKSYLDAYNKARKLKKKAKAKAKAKTLQVCQSSEYKHQCITSDDNLNYQDSDSDSDC